MASPGLNVNVYAIGGTGLVSHSLAISPIAPIGSSLAAAMPALAAPGGSSLAAPSALIAAPGEVPPAAAMPALAAPSGLPSAVSLGSPVLSVLRQKRLVALDPSKSAEQQYVTDGDDLILQPVSLTDDELLTTLVALTIEQGQLQKAFAALNEKREFTQKDWALRFILTTFGGLVSVSIGMLIADGLKVWGFQLNTFVRNSLVTSVVGEVAGLVVIAFRFIFSDHIRGSGAG